jgi:hypothetical protein
MEESTAKVRVCGGGWLRVLGGEGRQEGIAGLSQQINKMHACLHPANTFTGAPACVQFLSVFIFQAIRIDEVPADSLTSSMVDDVFFVLLKAGRRAMGTGKAPSVVAILNQLNMLLSTIYRNATTSRLAGAASRAAAAAPSEPSAAAGKGAAAAAVAFNNADVSAAYVAKLRQQLEELAGQVFSSANDRDRIKLVRLHGRVAVGKEGPRVVCP